MTSVALFGASGFVGSAVLSALKDAGLQVRALKSPRLIGASQDLAEWRELDHVATAVRQVVPLLHGADVVINAAGLASPGGRLSPDMIGANALLPRALGEASRLAGARRFIHVSSAAVLGRERLSDAESWSPLTPYGRTKAAGERFLLSAGWERGFAVAHRATSVHAINRSVTRSLVKIARSRLAWCEAPGNAPTPQVLVEELAETICVLTTTDRVLPRVSLEPWRGISVVDLLTWLGGREPQLVPSWVARATVGTGSAVGAMIGRRASARKLELLVRGQSQVPGWLDELVDPRTSPEAWTRLGVQVQSSSPLSRQGIK